MSFCSQGGRGGSVQRGRGLCPEGSLSPGGSLCPGGSLSRESLSRGNGVSVRGSLSGGQGVSVQLGLCPGEFCQGEPPPHSKVRAVRNLGMYSCSINSSSSLK